MEIAAHNERRLWRRAGVRSVAELPGFPFATHDEFVTAVRSNHANVGVDFSAARNMLGVIESRNIYFFLHGLLWIPAILGIGSIPLAIVRGDWLALFGLPAAALALFFGSPYMPLHKITLRLGFVAAAYVLLTGPVFEGLRWATVCFGGSMFTFWYVNSVAHECARAATLTSEAFAAFLFGSRNLIIRDTSGRVHRLEDK